MKKKGGWKGKLTKRELKHLKESGINYKWQLEEQRKHIKDLMKKHDRVCYDCVSILKKLDMW